MHKAFVTLCNEEHSILKVFSSSGRINIHKQNDIVVERDIYVKENRSTN